VIDGIGSIVGNGTEDKRTPSVPNQLTGQAWGGIPSSTRQGESNPFCGAVHGVLHVSRKDAPGSDGSKVSLAEKKLMGVVLRRPLGSS
jgi:hypothetical protein